MRKLVVYILIIVVIAIAVISGKKAINKKIEDDKKVPVAKEYSLKVKVINSKLKKNTLTLPYLATTKSDDNVKISSRVNARINFIIKSGTTVQKGDTIVKIDDKDLKTKFKSYSLNISSLKSQLKSKNIALDNLISTHQRTKKLLAVKGASKEQFDKEQTNIEAMISSLDTLKFKVQELQANKISVKNMLSYTSILAPVSGIVTKLANVGDIAMMGKPLLSISSSSNSYLLVQLPYDVKSSSILFENKKYILNPLNTTNNGLLEYLANINSSLATNQLVNIEVIVYDDLSYMLPHDAILNKNGKSYVLVVNKQKAIPKEVSIISNGEQGVIVKDITEDDKIVVAKPDILLKLATGIAIDVIK